MSKVDLKERRAHERRDTTLRAQGTTDAGGVVARLVARNLSLGGLYCTSNQDFPEMTRLAVSLMLPEHGSSNGDAEPLDIEAVVVRREKLPDSRTGEERFRFALYFTNLEQSSRERIRFYMERQWE